jgi:SpoVK/Ycf46/Vps4 family AAA+-type ATPase
MQRLEAGWLTKEMLASAYRHMVVHSELLAQIGPAVNAGKSLLIYGRPGNGKTYLAEGLFHLECRPVYIPYAIEAQGNLIQLYDPLHHQSTEPQTEEAVVLSAVQETDYDRRWIRVKRPFIVSGGELTLEMLDLSFDPTSKIYDAPFHLKANNGIYLIDDFGRGKVTPAEVLNRWIVPMERRIDFLNFRAGGKVSVPFEAFLVFSTNLSPEQLGDEAFLRRIQYKMFLRSPDEDEFLEILERVCVKENLPAPRPVLDAFLDRHYRNTKKPFRRCHPRDVVTHAVDLIQFERLPYQLTEELLDRAFESTFVTDQYED